MVLAVIRRVFCAINQLFDGYDTNALAVAQRCEAELGDERMSFIDGRRRDWEQLPIPDGPITVGIGGGYVCDWDERKGHFEVMQRPSLGHRR